MPVYVALLQGVNIGSKKRIRMEGLRALIAGVAGTDARTYVTSGNVVFRHDELDASALEQRIAAAVNHHVGTEVPVFIRTAEEMRQIVADNPFPDAESDPKTLHVLFLRDTPAIEDIDEVDEMETGPDRLAINRREVYFFLPNLTSGATVDVAKVGKMLRTVGTSRNWNTVTKLAGMSADQAGTVTSPDSD